MTNLIAPEMVKNFNIVTARNAVKERDIWQDWNRASNIGWADDCLRFLVLERTCPEKATESTLEKQRIFDEGKKQEWLMRKDTLKSGFTLIPVSDEPLIDHELKIKGTVDDLLKISKDDIRPIDYKSASSHMFSHISQFATADDLRASQHSWVRHYPAQLYIYLHLYEYDNGILLFKNKDSGEIYPLDVPKDEIYFEHLKDGIREVNIFIEKGRTPKPAYKDVCSKCKYREHCFPDAPAEEEGAEVERIENPELEMMLARRAELNIYTKEYKDLDKEIKERLKGKTVVIGDWMYKTSSYPRAGYDIPEDIKREFKHTFQATRVTIKNLKSPI